MTISETDSISPGSLSPLIRLGTSTWTYEGWQGDVYRKPYPKSRFKRDCLAEYATYEYEGERLFRTVGADIRLRSTDRQAAGALREPASLRVQDVHEGMEEITVPVYPSGLRYAKKAGKNPHFLDASYFQEQVLSPFEEPSTSTRDRSSLNFSGQG